MVRAPANYVMDYDPITQKMRSRLGWSERNRQAEMEYINSVANRDGRRMGEFFWVFTPPQYVNARNENMGCWRPYPLRGADEIDSLAQDFQTTFDRSCSRQICGRSRSPTNTGSP